MKKHWFTLSATAILFAACGKKPEAAPPTPATSQAAEAASLQGQVDPNLTALLRKFEKEKGRMPNSILELSAVTDSIPRAPEGYTYQIDTATKEVKLVKR